MRRMRGTLATVAVIAGLWTFQSQQLTVPHGKVLSVHYMHHHVKRVIVHHLTNATSTDTPAWQCIRQHESTNGKLSNNIYQIQNPALMKAIGMTLPPGEYTRSQQNVFALRAYANALAMFGTGWHPWLADYVACGL